MTALPTIEHLAAGRTSATALTEAALARAQDPVGEGARVFTLLDAGRATMDPAERLKIYRQINNLLAKDLPYLELTYFNNYSISGANVKGIVPVPDGLIRVRDVWKER